MRVDEQTAAAGVGTAERLTELREKLGPEKPEEGATGTGIPGEGGSPGPEKKMTPEEQALMAISYIDKIFEKRGLTKLDELQSAVLFMGIAATVKKYELDLSSLDGIAEKYPLPVLVLGSVWIGMDKVKEYKAVMEAKKAAEAKAEAEKKEQQPHD